MSSAYDIDVPADATSIGTRCCGATSVHFIDCAQRLDIGDPRSYGPEEHVGDPTDTEHCFYCGRELTEPSDGGWWPADYRYVEDAEAMADVPMCDRCWEKVP